MLGVAWAFFFWVTSRITEHSQRGLNYAWHRTDSGTFEVHGELCRFLLQLLPTISRMLVVTEHFTVMSFSRSSSLCMALSNTNFVVYLYVC